MLQNKQQGLYSLGLGHGHHFSTGQWHFNCPVCLCIYRSQTRVSALGSNSSLSVRLNSQKRKVCFFHHGMFSKWCSALGSGLRSLTMKILIIKVLASYFLNKCVRNLCELKLKRHQNCSLFPFFHFFLPTLTQTQQKIFSANKLSVYRITEMTYHMV